MATKRGTFLMAEGTVLEAMFSGCWEKSLDRDGRVFLDFNPSVFRIVLSHLRVLRDAKPGHPVQPPVVPPKHRAEFESMINFMEVRTLVYGKPFSLRAGALKLTPPILPSSPLKREWVDVVGRICIVLLQKLVRALLFVAR